MAYLWPNKKEACCCIACFTLRQISPIHKKRLYMEIIMKERKKLLVDGANAKLRRILRVWGGYSRTKFNEQADISRL